jgi:hypothetical protein
MKSRIPVIVFAAAILALQCDKIVISPNEIPANIYDTLSVNFVPPSAALTSGPSEGQVVQSASVVFAWSRGSSTGSCYYRMDNGPGRSTTRLDTTFTELDEGSHIFYLQGLHMNGVSQEPLHPRSFTVNAVPGPSIMVKPRLQTCNLNDEFDCEIWAEEVTGLMGTKITVQFDKNYLMVVTNPQVGSFLRKNNGEIPSWNLQYDNANGKIVAELVVLGGNPRGVNGSGNLVTITFKAIQQGMTKINFSTSDLETTYRDSQNNKIRIVQFISGNVIIN